MSKQSENPDLIPELILASGSPRRAELLTQIGLKFSRMSPDIDETPLADEPGRDYVSRMAQEKLKAAFQTPGLSPAALVLCADTTVLLGDEILGKPVDEQDATRMLQALSGSTHDVVTSVAMGRLEMPITNFSVETKVKFRTLTRDEISAYWRTGEPADKAGSYGAQGLGAIFMASIEGSFSNVVGLPLSETAAALSEWGLPILNK